MESDKRPLMTSLCYIRWGKQVLLLHRTKKKDDINEGKWIGIGGKYLPGEGIDEGMLREVYEETGLRLLKYHFHGVVSFLNDQYENESMFLFTGWEHEGELKEDCDEGILKWVPETEVLSLPTWEGDPYFLGPLLKGQLHIDMKLFYHKDTLWKVEDWSQGVPTVLYSGTSEK